MTSDEKKLYVCWAQSQKTVYGPYSDEREAWRACHALSNQPHASGSRNWWVATLKPLPSIFKPSAAT